MTRADRAVLDRIEAELARRPATRDLVLAPSSVSHIDLTAAEALERLRADLEARGIVLHLAEVKGPVWNRSSLGSTLSLEQP